MTKPITDEQVDMGATGKKPYHHGDLRNKLIQATIEMIEEGGAESVSLRKLAERVQVSRTAPYHHFKDKNELLASVAEQGFDVLNDILETISESVELPLQVTMERAVFGYIQFALDNPAQYALMFGERLWKRSPSSRLQNKGKNCFRQYVDLFQRFQDSGVINSHHDALRLAQLVWSLLHGLVTLSHDGVFVRSQDLNDIAQYALDQLSSLIHSD